MQKKIFFIFGTRPEAIKLAPLIKAFKERKDFSTCICVSSQHKELLSQVLHFFDILIDYDLDIMSSNQSLFDITNKCLGKLEHILKDENPDLVVVQGDTSTAFSGALAAFYLQIPVAHVEAGLRTYDMNNPFPEEMNRNLISKIATYHFSPTETSLNQLKDEGIKKNLWNVGNTIIDALQFTNNIVSNGFNSQLDLSIDEEKQLILVTGHRRENIGSPFKKLCEELVILSQDKNLEIAFPLHLNPKLKNIAKDMLKNHDNIHLLSPQPYPEFVQLIKRSTIIVTDSGGIQEEAPLFGKPIIVTRKTTERTESLNHNSLLIDLETESLSEEVLKLLHDKARLGSLSKPTRFYGDGTSSKQIVSILSEKLGL